MPSDNLVDTYPHHYNFRMKLAALALDHLWTGEVGHVVKPEYFEDEAEQEAVAAIYAYREKYDRTPLDPVDVIELCINPRSTDIVYDIYDRQYDDMGMPKDVAIQWAREQALKIAIIDSIPEINRGNLSLIQERIEAALSVGKNVRSSGFSVKNVNAWLYELYGNKVATGWPHLDLRLHGGADGGELSVILAPTNKGKSTALVNIAYGCATIGSAKNAVIFTHELSPAHYAARVAARATFKFPNDSDLTTYGAEFASIAARMLPGDIRIEPAVGMSVHGMRDAVNKMQDEGYEIDLIISDYADLIRPITHRKDRRFELTEIYEWLREYANSFKNGDGIPIWTASQVGRSAYSREVIRIDDISEDIGKANTADNLIALCQTPDELRRNRCRLFLAKARNTKANYMLDAKYFMDAQAIITIGETPRVDEEVL